ncbi:MAG: hypothetical protein JWP96_508 [Polaromonas sp.]|nr:hypothetical protein [Polaromonas sp.]
MQSKHHSSEQPATDPEGPASRPASNSELAAGVKRGLWIALSVLAIGLPSAHLLQKYRAPAANANPSHATSILGQQARHADFSAERASDEVKFIANWVSDSGDNRKMSFVIIDKKNAKVFVFNESGKLLGAAPVLLGAAVGDHTVPGIGQRPLAQVLPEERTTPAGRFVGEPGRNASGEDVVWVDYDAAVSMHRVRTGNPKEHRLDRLATPTAADNRISYGCINMPAAFYENVLSPVFKARYGVVYVLPEVKPLREVFAAAYAQSEKYGVSAAGQRVESAGAGPARL